MDSNRSRSSAWQNGKFLRLAEPLWASWTQGDYSGSLVSLATSEQCPTQIALSKESDTKQKGKEGLQGGGGRVAPF